MVDYLLRLNGASCLVTGGLGFVGNSLVRALVTEYDCKVIVVDNCLNSSPEVISDIADRVEFHNISVLDKDKLFPLIDRVNFVFHLACVQIAASGSNPLMDLEVNAKSTLEILEHLRHSQPVKLERFIYTSSASVYGSTTKLPLDERSPKNVLSNYAATKMLGENYTLIYGRNYGIPVTSVRYSNVYGYGQSPHNPYCGVLGKFVHNALTGKLLTVIGDGEQTRDYTFITDAVRATLIAAVHPRALGDVFNIGTNVETSVNGLVELISRYVKDVESNSIPERDIDNIRRRVLDMENIHQRLGWAPRVNMNKGIELTIEWYKSYLESQKTEQAA